MGFFIGHRYRVTTRGKRISINGILTADVLPDVPINGLCRLIGETKDGFIVKADFPQQLTPESDLYNQTAREIKLLPSIRERDKKYFPKIISHGVYKRGGRKYHWIIEEKIEISERNRVLESKAEVKLQSILRKYDIGDVQCRTSDNWTCSPRGKPIILDWGIWGDKWFS